MSKTTINPEALKNLLATLIKAASVGVEIDHDIVISRLDDVFPQEKEPKWKPQFGERYWRISVIGEIYDFRWSDDSEDNALFNFNNCFPTRELAEKRKAQWIALASEEE